MGGNSALYRTRDYAQEYAEKVEASAAAPYRQGNAVFSLPESELAPANYFSPPQGGMMERHGVNAELSRHRIQEPRSQKNIVKQGALGDSGTGYHTQMVSAQSRMHRAQVDMGNVAELYKSEAAVQEEMEAWRQEQGVAVLAGRLSQLDSHTARQPKPPTPLESNRFGAGREWGMLNSPGRDFLFRPQKVSPRVLLKAGTQRADTLAERRKLEAAKAVRVGLRILSARDYEGSSPSKLVGPTRFAPRTPCTSTAGTPCTPETCSLHSKGSHRRLILERDARRAAEAAAEDRRRAEEAERRRRQEEEEQRRLAAEAAKAAQIKLVVPVLVEEVEGADGVVEAIAVAPQVTESVDDPLMALMSFYSNQDTEVQRDDYGRKIDTALPGEDSWRLRRQRSEDEEARTQAAAAKKEEKAEKMRKSQELAAAGVLPASSASSDGSNSEAEAEAEVEKRSIAHKGPSAVCGFLK